EVPRWELPGGRRSEPPARRPLAPPRSGQPAVKACFQPESPKCGKAEFRLDHRVGEVLPPSPGLAPPLGMQGEGPASQGGSRSRERLPWFGPPGAWPNSPSRGSRNTSARAPRPALRPEGTRRFGGRRERQGRRRSLSREAVTSIPEKGIDRPGESPEDPESVLGTPPLLFELPGPVMESRDLRTRSTGHEIRGISARRHHVLKMP